MIGISSTTGGYLTVASDGGIFTYGSAGFFGSLAGSTVYSPPSAAVNVGADGVTDFQRQAWFRVNMCEEGGLWNVNGPVYSGGLGFSHANWAQFNTFGYPANAAYATPEQQIRVAVAFAVRYWGNPNAAPDQHGCSGRVLTARSAGLPAAVGAVPSPPGPASPPSVGGPAPPPAGAGSSPGTR